MTGASGFVGTALLAALGGYHDVTALGRHFPGAAGLTNVHADLSDPAAVRDALDRLEPEPPFDAIVHLAVSRRHREFPAGALDMLHVNATAAAALLDFARRTGVAHVVLGSTGSVQGPPSYFAATKLFADSIGEHYRDLLPVTGLRFHAPYGPGLRGRLLADLVARVRSGRPLLVPAEGPGLRFAAIYIDDAVAVIARSLRERWNETLDVAAPEEWSIETAGRLIGELVGRAALYEVSPAASAAAYLPDTGRLRERMPGHAFIGLREGLLRMIAAEAKA